MENCPESEEEILLRRRLRRSKLAVAAVTASAVLCAGALAAHSCISSLDAVDIYANIENIATPPSPNPSAEVIDAFPSSMVPAMKKELEGKKLALALITTEDYNSATEGMEQMFEDDFSDMPGYKLYTERIDNSADLFNTIRDYSAVKSIDALVLAFHGGSDLLNINFSERISANNAKRLFRDYSQCFSENAVIIFYSCSTGSGDENIANSLADALQRDVIAPKFALIPETELSRQQRVGEFAADSSGRLAFDYANLRLYPAIEFRGSTYYDALAAVSYEKARQYPARSGDAGDYFLFIDKAPFSEF